MKIKTHTVSHSSKIYPQEAKEGLGEDSDISFSAFLTLASGASIARGRPPPNGGARLAPSLRSRRDTIGQKPEPTFH